MSNTTTGRNRSISGFLSKLFIVNLVLLGFAQIAHAWDDSIDLYFKEKAGQIQLQQSNSSDESSNFLKDLNRQYTFTAKLDNSLSTAHALKIVDVWPPGHESRKINEDPCDPQKILGHPLWIDDYLFWFEEGFSNNYGFDDLRIIINTENEKLLETVKKHKGVGGGYGYYPSIGRRFAICVDPGIFNIGELIEAIKNDVTLVHLGPLYTPDNIHMGLNANKKPLLSWDLKRGSATKIVIRRSDGRFFIWENLQSWSDETADCNTTYKYWLASANDYIIRKDQENNYKYGPHSDWVVSEPTLPCPTTDPPQPEPEPQPSTCNISPNETGVILYSKKDWDGRCVLLRSDNPNLDLLMKGEGVTSIRINGSYQIKLYGVINYGGGAYEEINRSESDISWRSLKQYLSARVTLKSGCDDENAAGVFLYSDKKHGGTCVYRLNDVDDLTQTALGDGSGKPVRVYSVRINGDYELILFEEKDQKGRSEEVHHDEDDLSGRSVPGYRSAHVEATNIKCDNTDRPGVYLYSETKYKGSCYYTISDIPDFDLTPITNDHLRSVRIVGSFEVKIYKDKQYGEPHVRFSQSRDDLTKDSLGNQYSSIQVSRKNIAPNAPIPISPLNNATFETEQVPLLCWQSGGDSDGDALQFQIRLNQASQTLAASDWQTDLCWQSPALAVGAYTWEVQAHDGGLATSPWSPSYNFTINLKPTDTPTPTPTPTSTSTPTPTATPTEINEILPDLVVEFMKIELETGGACNFTSTQLGIRVGIANIGQADAGSFVITVFDREQTVSGLAAGQRTSVWLAGSHSGGEITAEIDAHFQIVESNETNNQLTQFVPVPTLPPTCTPEITTTPPTDTPTPTATITPTGTPQPGQIILAFDGPASVTGGEPFTVIVKARGVIDPGLYGTQLDINYDPTKVSASNLRVNPDFTFVLPYNADNINGKIQLVASRQGAVSGLTGDVTLLTFDVTVAANASDNVTFSFANEKAGDSQAKAYILNSQSYTVLIERIPTPTPSFTSTPTLTVEPSPTAAFTPTPTPTPTDGPTTEPTIPTITPTQTSTPSPTIEPTITSTPTTEATSAIVFGQVSLPGRVLTDWSGATITINDSSQSATTDTIGKFSILNIIVGPHTSITADAPGYLPAVCTAFTVTAPETQLTTVALLSGDIDNDNYVGAVDSTTIGVSFGLTGPNLPADINRDNVVDIFDIILVSINFGQSTQVWNCQSK